MNKTEAIQILHDYYDNTNRSKDDEFLYTEALGYLISETKEPKYMAELAWYYCGLKRFDLELKYLEMAAEYGYGPAYEELGYMWYYGQHGEKDYKKAFEYYTKGCEPDRYGNKGSLWCKFKLADMYRFGCAVEKDEARYCRMIEEAYDEVRNARYLNEPFPEIALRLAGIRHEQGYDDTAIRLLTDARRFMAERMSYDAFWGNIEVMGRIIRFLYQLKPITMENVWFYDLFYLTQTPGRFKMGCRGKRITIDVTEKDGELCIGYDGRCYRSFEDFCGKARFDGVRFTEIYDEIYDIREEESTEKQMCEEAQ